MSPKRINQRLSDFKKALARLKKSLSENPKTSDTIVDGTIQRFEFTFELAWKLAKEILQYKGIDAKSPRDVIKEAFQQGLMAEGEAWIEMLEERNLMSHIYDETAASTIYQKIKKRYFPLLETFLSTVNSTRS